MSAQNQSGVLDLEDADLFDYYDEAAPNQADQQLANADQQAEQPNQQAGVHEEQALEKSLYLSSESGLEDILQLEKVVPEPASPKHNDQNGPSLMGDDLSLGTMKIESDYLPSESVSHRQPVTDRSQLSNLNIDQVIEKELKQPAIAFQPQSQVKPSAEANESRESSESQCLSEEDEAVYLTQQKGKAYTETVQSDIRPGRVIEVDSSKMDSHIAINEMQLLVATRTDLVTEDKLLAIIDEEKQDEVLQRQDSHIVKVSQNSSYLSNQQLSVRSDLKSQAALSARHTETSQKLLQLSDEIIEDSAIDHIVEQEELRQQQQEIMAFDDEQVAVPTEQNLVQTKSHRSGTHRSQRRSSHRSRQSDPGMASDDDSATETQDGVTSESETETSEDQQTALTALKKAQSRKTRSAFARALARMRVGVFTNDEIRQAHPHANKQFCLDLIRFVGALLFAADWCIKYIYFLHSRFVTLDIYEVFKVILYARLIFVLLYHFYRFWCGVASLQKHARRGFSAKYAAVYTGKVVDAVVVAKQNEYSQVVIGQTQSSDALEASSLFVRDPNHSNRIACGILDILFQLVFLPASMLTGFYRLVTFSRAPQAYIFTAVSQELMLHQVPLSILIYYNNQQMQFAETSLIKTLQLLTALNITWLSAELFYFKFYMAKGINLDQRIKMPEAQRFGSYICYCIVSVSIIILVFTQVFPLVEGQECPKGFFNRDQSELCGDCSLTLGNDCLACNSTFNCQECAPKTYLDKGKCFSCAKAMKGCITCTKEDGCLQCEDGYYLKNKNCYACNLIVGCDLTQCSHEQGCMGCQKGYFWERGQCYSCASRLPGCVDCISKTQCRECKNEWLTVDPITQQCTCNVGTFEHMSSDSRGSCQCENGMYLTEDGCKTCAQMIPGCSECYQTSTDTQIPIFGNATVTSSISAPRQYYVDCRTCDYGHYKVRANFWQGTGVSCPACSEKWEGCGVCGSTGNFCTKCLHTHVFTSSRNKEPCVPCDFYMSGCTWCRSQTDCVEYG